MECPSSLLVLHMYVNIREYVNVWKLPKLTHNERVRESMSFWEWWKFLSFPPHFLPHILIAIFSFFVFDVFLVSLPSFRSDTYFLNNNNVTIIPSYETFESKWRVRENEIGCEIRCCDSKMWVKVTRKLVWKKYFMEKFAKKYMFLCIA